MTTRHPVHSLCRATAPYQIEVGGVLTPTRIRRGRHLVTVGTTGEWQIHPEEGHPRVAARFPHALAAPALYDAHIHLHPATDMAAYLRYGVARVRDLGSHAGAGQQVPTPRDCSDPVPEIVLGGPLFDGPGKPRLPIAAIWNDPEDLPALFDAAAGRGATWIKLYERFPAALFRTAVRLAHSRGLRVTVHPAPGDYPAAVAAGVDELQHLPCLIPPGARGTHALHRRWAERRPEDTWPELPSGTAVCPTLWVQAQLVREAEQHWAFPGHEPGFAGFWRQLRIADGRWSNAELTAGQLATSQVSSAVRRLDRAGVRWVVGSDTPNPGLRPGESLWQEMNLLISAGLDRLRVYRSAGVTSGLADTGGYPLALLPLSSFESQLFPVRPAEATLLRGCLFLPTR